MKIWVLLVLMASSSLVLAQPDQSAQNDQSDLPFSKIVKVGNILYLSGDLGVKPGTIELVPGGIGPETRQTMENIQATLKANGSGMDKVIKCLVMLADINEWAAMNEVYVTFFDTPPARSALGASGLALDARMEIECIGVIG